MFKLLSVKFWCFPSCSRHDRRYTLFTSEVKRDRNQYFEEDIPDFRLELGYRDLEYEFYNEFQTISIPRFISESLFFEETSLINLILVGGSFGLFAGVTIITVIQLLLNLFMLAEREIRRFWNILNVDNQTTK